MDLFLQISNELRSWFPNVLRQALDATDAALSREIQ